MLRKIAASTLALGLMGSFAAACAAPSESKPEAVDETTQEFGLRDTKIAGSLAYGETSPKTSYKFNARARYVAYKFAGGQGDEVDVWVKSSNGDPVTWILDNDWRVVGKNDDASSTNTNSHVTVKLPANASATHYVVVRDYWLDPMSFKVELKGKSADLAAGCEVDADCQKIEKGCCALGNYIAVHEDNVASYQASLGCDPTPICPMVMIKPDHAMAQCNFESKKCELVQPKDIVCEAFSLNPHACPANFTCLHDMSLADVGGKCVQNCGGFAGFQCSDPNEECVDNPNDDCDPKNGGADCGGICQPKAAQGACKKTGCSGQICADQDMVSTCEWRDEYACYASATCERQADGKCGWTQTPALTACLANP